MENIDLNSIQEESEKIVRDYLYNISSLRNHNYFLDRENIDSRSAYFQSQGFQILCNNDNNLFVVKEEMFLEGCTRTFLVNPLLKMLFEMHGIFCEWKYGTTFAKFNISNREYELGSYVEFVIRYENRNIGCRYTPASYRSEEVYAMEKDANYLWNDAKIPGFTKLNTIDELWAIDWSGITEESLAKIHQQVPGTIRRSKDISVQDFFRAMFTMQEYDIFVRYTKRAIEQAKSIIALKAVPQLLPNNMLTFKETVMIEFEEVVLDKLKYEFKNKGSIKTNLSEDDVSAIKEAFYKNKYRNALIGDADFAKSFITSEYLFSTVNKGLSIDYTSVVVGYLKSVEQLLYMLYISAFGGSAGIKYWDTCNREKNFDVSKSEYRYDPYSSEKQRKSKKQEKYYHKKKTGKNAPEIGALILFLRYYEKSWNVSEDGKEYIIACLDDYRTYCRNHHFHKNNIGTSEYEMVKRIRNNAHICLYYLLGAFKFLDMRSSVEEQLGIVDYSFERLHREIWQKRRKVFWVKTVDGYEGIIVYLMQNALTQYDESGRLRDDSLVFIKFESMDKESLFLSEVDKFMADEEYRKNNTLFVTRDTMPLEIKAIPFAKRTHK